jgi:hypothetical protein
MFQVFQEEGMAAEEWETDESNSPKKTTSTIVEEGRRSLKLMGFSWLSVLLILI